MKYYWFSAVIRILPLKLEVNFSCSSTFLALHLYSMVLSLMWVPIGPTEQVTGTIVALAERHEA